LIICFFLTDVGTDKKIQSQGELMAGT